MKDSNKILFSLFSVALTMFTVWLAVIVGSSPYTADPLTHIVFWGSWFLWLSMVLSLLLIYLRAFGETAPNSGVLIKSSLLHSLLISFTIIALLALHVFAVLGVLEFAVIIIVYILAFMLIKSKEADERYK